jgi:hypothetical protein
MDGWMDGRMDGWMDGWQICFAWAGSDAHKHLHSANSRDMYLVRIIEYVDPREQLNGFS